MAYLYPKTIDEWWALVDDQWYNLIGIFRRFDHESTPSELEKMKYDRNPELGACFDTVWDAAPDAPWIHSIPGWEELCDLCSERHLFN